MFDMRKSNCSKADHKELNDECHPDAEDVVNHNGAHSIFLNRLQYI